MKRTILLFLLPLAMLPAIAQTSVSTEKKFQLGVGLGAGVYTDDANIFNASLEVQGEGKLVKALSLYCGLAYNRMFSFEGGGSAGYGSLLAGPKAWVSEKFFIGMGAGLALFVGSGESNAVFNYNPHIGLNTRKGQFTLGYNSTVSDGYNVGFIQLRAIAKLK